MKKILLFFICIIFVISTVCGCSSSKPVFISEMKWNIEQVENKTGEKAEIIKNVNTIIDKNCKDKIGDYELSEVHYKFDASGNVNSISVIIYTDDDKKDILKKMEKIFGTLEKEFGFAYFGKCDGCDVMVVPSEKTIVSFNK